MLQGSLWMALIVAGLAGLTAAVATHSFLWAFLAYSGAGMAVLFSLLAAEVFFGEAPSEIARDDTGIAPGQRG